MIEWLEREIYWFWALQQWCSSSSGRGSWLEVGEGIFIPLQNSARWRSRGTGYSGQSTDRIFRCPLEITGAKYPVTTSISEFWSLAEFRLWPDIPVTGNIRYKISGYYQYLRVLVLSRISPPTGYSGAWKYPVENIRWLSGSFLLSFWCWNIYVRII